MLSMLTKNDKKEIGEIVDEKLEKFGKDFEQKLEQKLDEKLDEKFGEFAIMIQRGFAECANREETQASFAEVRQDIVDLRQDVGYLKNEVAELRFEVYSKKDDGKI